ncbi:MAG: hypothetical protein RIQ53_967 [Pseudomonadota bacterium]
MTGRAATGLVIGHVRAVLCGRVQPLGHRLSAIDKRPVDGPMAVGPLGLDGDAQADRRVHGGPDKALHVYPWAHHAHWRAELPGLTLWDAPGAFGENLSVEGLDEHDCCIGDVWRIGSAVLDVRQGRQPCRTLNLRFGVPDMAVRVQDSLRAGWYLGVREPGHLAAGDAIERLARPHPGHTIAALLALIRDRCTDPAVLGPVLALPLPERWQRLFAQRMHRGQVEDWGARMAGAG